MKMTVTLVDPEASYVVEVDARDRRQFELRARDTFGKAAAAPTIRGVAQVMPENYTYWMAWHALATRGNLPITWAQFDARAVELTVHDSDSEDDALDPTQRAATPD